MMLERLGDLLDFDEFEPATRQYFQDAPIGSVVCMLDRPGQTNVEYVALLALASVWLLEANVC